MKIVYYCQHVLGIGHFHRSLAICRELAAAHDVTMITGGAPVETGDEQIAFFQLPGLMMDATFNNLAPTGTGTNTEKEPPDTEPATLETVKRRRAALLYTFFEEHRPDACIIELYPFGRKSFRFELDPVLQAIRDGRLPGCHVFCSLRDILVERHDSGKFEQRVITTLNDFFDGLLIHGDKKCIALDATFSRLHDITIPMAYTGYVTPFIPAAPRADVRHNLGFSDATSLIVASIGGGNVGSELLLSMAEAMSFMDVMDDPFLHLQIFTGPYIDNNDLTRLSDHSDARITVSRFTAEFMHWLRAADLSVSMAGYNTTMNILQSGVPALLYPFGQNQEQLLRLQALGHNLPLKMLEQRDLQPETLAGHVRNQLRKGRFSSTVNLNGAAETARLIEHWSR
ncbi:MAG: glycosyltransferase family protein [Desulfopila sp.]